MIAGTFTDVPTRGDKRRHALPAHLGLGRRQVSGALIALGILVSAVPAAEATSAPAPSATSASTSYHDVELYYFHLMNCTRTGGNVRADGTCDGYGSGRFSAERAPFKLSLTVSNHVSRPYAQLLVAEGVCTHYADGDPSARLHRAGIVYHQWGENCGCRDGSDPRASVLASHLNFQSEESSNGWHWRNIKDAGLTRVGIGVWKSGSRIRLVVDFFRP